MAIAAVVAGDRVAVLLQLRQIALRRRQVAAHEADRIVDLVRDAGGELADRGQFFRLIELALAFVDDLDLFGDALLQLRRQLPVARLRGRERIAF